MQKKFIVNLGFVLLLNLLVKPFYILGIDAEVLNQVEASNAGSYGEYFSLMGLTFVLNIFLDFGIINFNTRNIAQNKQLLTKHFSGITSLRLLISFFYILLIVISGLIFGYSAHQFKLLGILAFNQVLVGFILYFRSNLSGMLKFKQDSIVSVLDRLLLIIICSTLLWGGVTKEPFKIEWFVYAQTFSYAFTMLVAGALVVKETGWFKPKLKKAFSLMILKQSAPYALLILLMMVYYRSDSIMLERMLPNGARESAIYAQGFRFFESLNMVGYLFAGLLLPLLAHMLKRNENVSSILMLAFKILFSISVVLGLAGYIFSEEIITWRYHMSGNELLQSTQSFQMLMLCFISICITYVFGTLLTAKGSLKGLNKIAFVGVLLNVGLNLYLIPIKGAYGAAIASLITQVLTAMAQVVMSFKEVQLKVDKKSGIQILVFISLISILFLIQGQIHLQWTSGLLIFVLIGTLIAFITGMVSIKGVIKIIRSKQ